MKVPAAIQEHPNASVALGTTPLATLIVWLLGNVLHLPDVSAEIGSLVAGLMISLVLLVGKYGLVGIWNRILHGDGTS